MNTIALRVLRPVLVLLFAGTLLALARLIVQVVSDSFMSGGENTVPAKAFGVSNVAAFVCVLVALAAMWKLLTFVKSDTIFAPESLRWVDLIIRMGWAVTGLRVLNIALSWQFIDGYQLGLFESLQVPWMFIESAASALAVTLLVLVLRQLLASAMTYKAELAEVV